VSAAASALVAGLIDYAGLFPPAGLGMAESVAAYAAQRRSADAWILGRFVVPVARLEEFAAAHAGLSTVERGEGVWDLSALLGPDVPRDARAAEAVNATLRGAVVIRSLEVRAEGVAQITAVRTAVAPAFELFYELPLRGDLRWLLAAVRAVGARAKIRTGGVTPSDIPAGDAVLKFLEGCAAIQLPFKATAGLHHAVRADRALTYEKESVRATMFGYVNVFLAAAALWLARPRGEALRLLESEDAASLAVDGEDLVWGASRFTAAEIARVRREFALAIGSCSFDEPVSEIRALGAVLDAPAPSGGHDTARGAGDRGSVPKERKAMPR
jgi:hypothetical protein